MFRRSRIALVVGLWLHGLTLGVLLGATVSCVPAKGATDPTRAATRETVLFLRDVTLDAMSLCESRSVDLAKAGDGAASDRLWRECQAGYAIARPSLIAAAHGVDAWGDASRGDVLCAALRGSRALVVIVGAVEASGLAHLPPALEDARVSADKIERAAVGFACPKS